MEGLTALTVVLAIFFGLRRNWSDMLLVIFARVTASWLNDLLKAIFARPRPFFLDPIATAAFYSFPSGHVMGSVIVYGLLAYLLLQRKPSRPVRLVIIGVTTLIVLLVGLSRMVLGVHYLSDVLAGFAAGGAWLVVCVWLRGVMNSSAAFRQS